MKQKKEVYVVVLYCKNTVISTGRKDEPEVSFIEGKTYFFVHEGSKNRILTVDETGEVHVLTKLKHIDEGILNDAFTHKHFRFDSAGPLSSYKDLNDLQRHKLIKLNKEKLNYSLD